MAFKEDFSLFNQWHNVTITFTDSLINLYFNGTLKVSEPSYIQFTDWDKIHTSYLFQMMHGAFDDVGLWRRVLTPAEIMSLYSNAISVRENKIDQTLLKVFPIPSSGNFTVDHPELYNVEPVSVYVVGKNGLVVHEAEYLQTVPIQLEISTPGSYHVILRNSKNEVIGLKQVFIVR